MSTRKRLDEGRLTNLILSPVVSEKATMVAEKVDTVVLEVLRDATKLEIKAAVELMLKVRVKSVNVLNVKGKVKRVGRSVGRRKSVRKAYVVLQPGQELNFSGEVA